MSSDRLCIFASKLEKTGSSKRIWETQGQYKPHVKEAKRRGLTCGVNKKTATNTGQQNNNSGIFATGPITEFAQPQQNLALGRQEVSISRTSRKPKGVGYIVE